MTNTLKIEGLCRFNVFRKGEDRPLYFWLTNPDPFNPPVFVSGTIKLLDSEGADVLDGEGTVQQGYINHFFATINTRPEAVSPGTYQAEVQLNLSIRETEAVVIDKTVVKVV